MEHSSGEATLSEPGVLGDRGLPTEVGDLGPEAVGLLRSGGGMTDGVPWSWGPNREPVGA